MIKRISFRNSNFQFVPHDTLIFFDELQEYPDCSTSLKFFAEDGRFDVICSGSMMGLNYKKISSNSVGHKKDVSMHSIDFEEYLWTKGYREDFAEEIYSHLKEQRPFSENEFKILNDYFIEYAVLGGMPAVIKQFLVDGTFTNILPLQKQLVLDYEEDITKYSDEMDKAKLKNIYRNIPVFLARENKKFQITKVAKNGATISLNNLISYPSYPDIQFGIKLAHKNIGFNGRFYIIPYFCTFLLKRFLNAAGNR